MPIPTPQADGDNRVLALHSRTANAIDDYEVEIDDESGDGDDVWVLSIHIEVADRLA